MYGLGERRRMEKRRERKVNCGYFLKCAVIGGVVVLISMIKPAHTSRAYQRKMAIRDYLAIFLRSETTRPIQKTMAIDRKKACITIIATGS